MTKNPARYLCHRIIWNLPPLSVLGCTIESNRDYNISNAPTSKERYKAMVKLKKFPKYQRFVSIEPIIDFDVDILVGWIKEIEPDFIAIGADSKRSGLKEPTGAKIHTLIEKLQNHTDIRLKKNIERIYKSEDFK
jgi:hypothetical protein